MFINSRDEDICPTFTKKTLTLIVSPLDTIGDVKVMIQDEEGIPSDQQALVFDQMVHDDIITLFEFNINESTLTLTDRSRGLMQIFVKHSKTKKTFSLVVKSTYIVKEVKTMIQDKEGIPTEEQVLIFNKMALDDSGDLADFNIQKESTLKLVLRWSGLMPIYAKTLTKKIFSLQVKPSDTIEDVKAKIEDQEGTPHACKC